MGLKIKNSQNSYLKFIVLLCALYAVAGLYFLVSNLNNLWYAKEIGIQAHMPLVIYLQVLGNYMLAFMYALISIIIFIVAIFGLWHQTKKYTPFAIIVLTTTILYIIDSYLQYNSDVTFILFALGAAIILLNSLSIIYLIKHHLFKHNSAQSYNQVFQRYRLINLYIYVLGLFAFLKFFFFLILFLYYGKYIWQSGVQWSIPADETILKILLSYSVAIFMISIFCGSKLWNFQKKMRVLSILLLLCSTGYHSYFLYYSVISPNYGYITQSCAYIIINLICIFFIKRHQFPKVNN